ncbi:MAG: glycosyltransferase [Comamonadaceae bacterium]|nr:MAG: glycosyltransferase [Comamonadaceae bacterium]
MKISVVTISFNQGQFLRECIDSVLGQNYPDLEYIVVDPGSKDNSREIIDSYGDRIVRVYEKDDGAADGLNRGFARATGEVLAFLNSDDMLLPGSLQRMADEFQRQPDVGLVSGTGWFTDEAGARTSKIVPSRMSPRMMAYGAVTVFQQGTFFRHDLFKKVGGFNLDNRTCWDAELFLDMAVAGGRSELIDDEIALFRIHQASITGSGRLNEQFQRDTERMFEKVMGRPARPSDGLAGKVARVLKFVRDPQYTLRRFG